LYPETRWGIDANLIADARGVAIVGGAEARRDLAEPAVTGDRSLMSASSSQPARIRGPS
jgi:hypothetical protein